MKWYEEQKENQTEEVATKGDLSLEPSHANDAKKKDQLEENIEDGGCVYQNLLTDAFADDSLLAFIKFVRMLILLFLLLRNQVLPILSSHLFLEFSLISLLLML